MAVNIVSLSGSKDGTALLLMMLERGMQVDRVICVDATYANSNQNSPLH